MQTHYRRGITTASLLLVLSFASLIMTVPVGATISCSSSASPAWQLCGPVETPNQINLQPNTIQAINGSLVMAWVSQVGSTYDVFIATGTFNTSNSTWHWTSGAILASLSGTNVNPALVQLHNGTIILFFAYKSTTAGHYQLYYTKNNAGLWTKKFNPVPLSTPTSLNDTLPSATVDKTGTLWLAWTRDNSTTTGNHVMRQLWYKTLTGNTWSNEQSITSASDPLRNLQPSIMTGKDGTVRIAYSRGVSSTGNFNIYLMNYAAGSGFNQPGAKLTNQTGSQDANPSLIQDRNGTLWLFWARGNNSTSFEIYDRSSTNYGSTWTPETVLTSSTSSDYQDPSAVQSTADKNIWVFLSYNPSTTYQIWALKTTNPIQGTGPTAIHDVSITFQPINTPSVPCPSLPGQLCFYQGGYNNSYMYLNNRYAPFFQPATIPVTVNLQNLGDAQENFTVTVNVSNTTSTSLGTQRIILNPGSSTVATFNFNTLTVRPAKYSFTGNITLASGETVTIGNKPDLGAAKQDPVHLLPLGDVDQDGSDTITDVSVVFFNYDFGCSSQISCTPQYIAAEWGAVDNSGIIDVVDASVAANDYGIIT